MPSFNETIKSVSYSQHEILYNIMQMHNEGKPFDCDMTYSKGAFYGDFTIQRDNGEMFSFAVPRPEHTFDVAPQDDLTVKIDPLGPLPLDDASIDSIVCDLPFVISCGPSMNGPDYDENGKRVKNNIISRRFASYYPVAQLTESYYHWMEEMHRVLRPDGIAIVKCQKTITGSKALNTPEFVWMAAESLGMDMMDSFMLVAKARLISGKVKQQQHSRRFESEFLVIRNNMKKKIKYLDFCSEETARKIVDGLFINNIAKRRK